MIFTAPISIIRSMCLLVIKYYFIDENMRNSIIKILINTQLHKYNYFTDTATWFNQRKN